MSLKTLFERNALELVALIGGGLIAWGSLQGQVSQALQLAEKALPREVAEIRLRNIERDVADIKQKVGQLLERGAR